jgi:hypothetical protein
MGDRLSAEEFAAIRELWQEFRDEQTDSMGFRPASIDLLDCKLTKVFAEIDRLNQVRKEAAAEVRAERLNYEDLFAHLALVKTFLGPTARQYVDDKSPVHIPGWMFHMDVPDCVPDGLGEGQ